MARETETWSWGECPLPVLQATVGKDSTDGLWVDLSIWGHRKKKSSCLKEQVKEQLVYKRASPRTPPNGEGGSEHWLHSPSTVTVQMRTEFQAP